MKKAIKSSNLALRFYIRDGWSKEELDKCFTKGGVVNAHPQDTDPYYVPDVGSHFDTKELIKRMSTLHRRFDDHPADTDAEFMVRLNWN